MLKNFKGNLRATKNCFDLSFLSDYLYQDLGSELMKKYLYGTLIGFVIGMTSVGVILKITQQHPPRMAVTENPILIQEREADMVLSETRTLNAAGRVSVTSDINMPVVVPVTGEVQTIYTDKRTGEVIGSGRHQVIGETQVTVTQSEVEVETRLEDITVVAVDFSQPSLRRNEIGILNDGDWIVYYKFDLANIGLVSPWVGTAYNFSDDDFVVAFGVTARF